MPLICSALSARSKPVRYSIKEPGPIGALKIVVETAKTIQVLLVTRQGVPKILK